MGPLECGLDRHDRRTWGRKMVWSPSGRALRHGARERPWRGSPGVTPRSVRGECRMRIAIKFKIIIVLPYITPDHTRRNTPLQQTHERRAALRETHAHIAPHIRRDPHETLHTAAQCVAPGRPSFTRRGTATHKSLSVPDSSRQSLHDVHKRACTR